MDDLKELVGILSKQKIKHLEGLRGENKQSSKLLSLFEGIRNGQFEGDKDAAKYFYGENPNKTANYNKLKNRLRRRLIHTIFSIDLNQPAYNDFQKAYYNCYKDWAAVKILIGKGARRTAIGMAEKTITRAIKFEFTYLALEASRLLRQHYAITNRNAVKYEKYQSYVKKYQELLQAELLAEEYHAELAGHFALSKTAKFEIANKAASYSKELKSLTGYLHSYRLNLFAHTVFVYRYQIINDYQNILKECKKAVSFFETKKHQASNTAIFNFLLKMLACHIQLRQFDEGEQVARRSLSMFSEKNQNWFFVQDLFFILCMHTGKFQQAYLVFKQVYQHKNFSKLYSNSTENWKIYEAYINYFIMCGEVKTDQEKSIPHFRLNKFLNELPVFSKDKRGKNIPILVIHILFLLQQQKYGAVIDRAEALNQYAYRYLRNDDTYRSNCFIKMLVQLPKANFHKQAVLRKTASIYSKLKNKPLEVSRQSDEIEIVPYEILWEFVLRSLDNSFH